MCQMCIRKSRGWSSGCWDRRNNGLIFNLSGGIPATIMIGKKTEGNRRTGRRAKGAAGSRRKAPKSKLQAPKKHQIPSSKHQRAIVRSVRLVSGARCLTHLHRIGMFVGLLLRRFGAWNLVLGASRRAPAAAVDFPPSTRRGIPFTRETIWLLSAPFLPRQRGSASVPMMTSSQIRQRPSATALLKLAQPFCAA